MKILITSSREYRSEWSRVKNALSSFGYEVVGADECEVGAESINDIVSNYLSQIDESGALYVYTEDGEVGKSVASEIGYAYAKGKKILSSMELSDDGLKYYVSKVLKV